jgi:hypothetical protein
MEQQLALGVVDGSEPEVVPMIRSLRSRVSMTLPTLLSTDLVLSAFEIAYGAAAWPRTG